MITHSVVKSAGCHPQTGAGPCEIFRLENLSNADSDLKPVGLGPEDFDAKAAVFTAETGSYMYMCPEVTRTLLREGIHPSICVCYHNSP